MAHTLGDGDYAMTSTELYAARNGDEPERRCEGCNASLEGRAGKTRYCSDSCRRKAQRSNGDSSETRSKSDLLSEPVPEPERESPSSDGGELEELLGAILTRTEQSVVAVTVEYAGGWSLTLGRTD